MRKSFSWGESPFSRILSAQLSRYKSNVAGGVAVIFAVFAMVLILMVGVAIDYALALRSATKLQETLDSSIIAAINTPASDRAAVASNFMTSAYFDSNATLTSSSFQYDTAAHKITASASAKVSSRFLDGLMPPITVGAKGSAVLDLRVRALDIVMCIDATGSMEPTLSAVQSNALNFKANLDAELIAQGTFTYDQYRVRVIYYRDYGGNGYKNVPSWFNGFNNNITGTALGDDEPMRASSFFRLPTETPDFQTFVTNISATGGGDLLESGLECLNEAMDSDWTKVGSSLPDGRRVDDVYPLIAIYTDTGAHPPNHQFSVANPNYPPPSKMPRTYEGLLAKWNSSTVIDQSNKMLLFYGNLLLGGQDEHSGELTGWYYVKDWPRFANPGNLTGGANAAIAQNLGKGIRPFSGPIVMSARFKSGS